MPGVPVPSLGVGPCAAAGAAAGTTASAEAMTHKAANMAAVGTLEREREGGRGE